MAEETTRYTGVVSRFLKGYGFIKPDDGIDELFVHQSDIKAEGYRTLKVGQSVEFVVVQEGGKTKAIDVTGPNGVAVTGGSDGGRSDRGDGYTRRNGNGGRDCYTCGEIGHLARDCNNKSGGVRVTNGGSRVGSRGGEGCFTCGEIGHIARDCAKSGGRVSNGGGGGSGCYTCGEVGHLARDCDKSGVRVAVVECFNCGGVGHISRDCPSGPRNGGGRRGGCYTCGLEGHLARDCSQAGGNSRSRGGGDKCFNCGKPGHFARECTEAIAAVAYA